MLNTMKELSNMTLTENGAATYASTESSVLDLFSSIGALRYASSEDIVTRLDRSWAESPDLTMKTLFYARDIRGGLGERRIFRLALAWLAMFHRESALKNMSFIPEYGRFDDLLTLLHTSCEAEVSELICALLRADQEAMASGSPVSLLGKWLPSVNASSTATRQDGKKIAKAMGMKDAEYRKLLTALRSEIHIVENNLREKDYSFDYAKLPSTALYKYRRAFIRNDLERYVDYLKQVSEGKAKMHTGTLTPYDVIAPFVYKWFKNIWLGNDQTSFGPEEVTAATVTWDALADFTGGDNALVVVDGSGSMYFCGRPFPALPAAVALSLGIYFGERNVGAFHNHFITFSHNPRLIEIEGETILDKLAYCGSISEVADTSIQKVFELVLKAALQRHSPQEELPTTLYFVSDMEFNSCTEDASLTNFEYAKHLYESHGYKLPQVVFWNVQSRDFQQPVTMNEQGVILVSGCTPRLFEHIMQKDYANCSPYAFMLDMLNSERYEKIRA